MGYDYAPCSRTPLPKTYKGVHLCYRANISGQSYLRELLGLLGEDTSRLAVTNDGLRVPKKTAISWGNAILNALDNNMLREKDNIPYLYEPPKKITKKMFLDALDNKGKDELDKGTKEWLRGLAGMFILSGGFRQY